MIRCVCQQLQWKTADAQAVVNKIRQGVDKDAATMARQQAEREEQHEQAARLHFQEQMDDARGCMRPEDSDDVGGDSKSVQAIVLFDTYVDVCLIRLKVASCNFMHAWLRALRRHVEEQR